MKIGLREIEYFAVMAEHGHVGRAAEALGLSQPALSRSLRRLEASIGARVVTRTPKGVALTAVGSALLAQVRRLRLAMDDVIREATDLGRGAAGHLRVGVGPLFDDLPAAYASLLEEASKLTLKIMVSDTAAMLSALRKGEIDLFVNYLQPASADDLAQEFLYEDETVVCASAQHRLAGRKRVTLNDLESERWILSDPTIPHVQWLFQQFQDRHLPPPLVAVETHPVRLKLQILAATDLLSFTSKRVLEQSLPRFRLKALPIKELYLRRPIGVIYRKDGYLPPAALRLIRLLRSATKAHAKH